jgi:hypothetical protein
MTAMRRLAWLSVLALAAGCGSGDDRAATGDDQEVVEGRASLERKLTPPVPIPTDTTIGKALRDEIARRTTNLTARTSTNDKGCAVRSFVDRQGAERARQETCEASDVLYVGTNEAGKPAITISDVNKDGKIDGVRDESGAFIAYTDQNFDGKVDRIVEAMERVDDFDISAFGKEWVAPEALLHRVRTDTDRDGTLDHEAVTARGVFTRSDRSGK